jgi:myo-inositol-1(or 4)-monophosphatase
MKAFIEALGDNIRKNVIQYNHQSKRRSIEGVSPGGDAQFDIDAIAEKAAVEFCREYAPCPILLYTEDGSTIEIGKNPEHCIIVDPIDGTRPTSANLEMGMISIAFACLNNDEPTIGDVTAAFLMEIASGKSLAGDKEGLSSKGFEQPIPSLSNCQLLEQMFWSIEVNGHPMKLMSDAYGHLVDRSANTGGVFIFNSASFSISRIITGQLDVYADVGNRLLKDHPELEKHFRLAGNGSILHLFPYDIAAAVYLAEQAGVVITDGYGESLLGTKLLDISPQNQRSCIAASTKELHEKVLNGINWSLAEQL